MVFEPKNSTKSGQFSLSRKLPVFFLPFLRAVRKPVLWDRGNVEKVLDEAHNRERDSSPWPETAKGRHEYRSLGNPTPFVDTRLGSHPCSPGIARIEVEEGPGRFCIQATILDRHLYINSRFSPAVSYPVRKLACSITW